jgi:hypothetical protein
VYAEGGGEGNLAVLFLKEDLADLFGGDIHVGRSLEDLGVVDVGDDGLELAGEVFV